MINIISVKTSIDEYTNLETEEYHVTFANGVYCSLHKDEKNKEYRQVLQWIQDGGIVEGAISE